MSALAVRSRRVVLPDGVRPACVVARGEVIESVGPYDAPIPPGAELLDVGDAAVLPGVVDAHVHVNDPGRTEWEGFETATRACAAGGTTTLVDMPLNCIPVTTTLAALRMKRDAVRALLRVDCGFWGGVVPGPTDELEAMIDAGACGFKCFLVHSGIDEFPNATERDLRAAMPVLARRGVPLLVHAEVELHPAPATGGAPSQYATYLASRPRAMENEAIRLMIRLCRETRCAVHIVHLSSAEALADIAAAKGEGLPLTVETCPHYLTFAAEEVPAGATQFKCAPPIRERENREALWGALREGVIDQVVSDHSPCTPQLKKLESGDFFDAWGGISSVQLALAAVWTEARERGAGLPDVARWMCAAPARLAGLDRRKGALAAGRDADMVIFDPDASFTVEPSMIHHKHKLTPYTGRRLFGVVRRTILRGATVFEEGRFIGAPRGAQLERRLSA